MESLIAQVQQEAASAGYAERKKLLDTLRDLQYSIEAPEDAMQRVIHMVCVLGATGDPIASQCLKS